MSTGYRVLYVDDDPASLDRTTAALEAERDEFVVRSTTDTDEALAWLAADGFDCVVTVASGEPGDPSSFLRAVADTAPDLLRLLFTPEETVPVDAVDVGVAGVVSREGDEPFARLASRIVEAVERRRAEAKQARDCRLFSTLVGESTDAFVVIGRDWQFEYASPAIERLLGYDPDELIGTTCFTYVHPDDRPRARERLDELADRPDAVFSDDLRLRHADGSWVWVENRGRNLLDDPDVEGIVISSRDVTERKRREERLRRAESIVESVDDVVYVVDESFTVTYVNDRALAYAELPREAIVGEPIRALSERMIVEPENVDRFLDALAAVVDGESESERLDFGIDLPRGTVFAELQISPLRPLAGDDEGPMDAVVVSRDVTARREYERQLERQNDRLDTFTSVISHDLRGPLSVAAGNVELVRQECDSDRLDVIARAHERMGTLVDNLLAVARHGTPVDEPEAVDLDAVAERCWTFVESADATVEIDTGLVVRADEWRLRQFFENLFRNSVEHGSADDRSETDDGQADPAAGDFVRGGAAAQPTDEGTSGDTARPGGVTVRVGRLDDPGDDANDGVRPQNGRGGFYVEDDGPGVPPEMRGVVFEIGHSRKPGGTGFGLWIVHEIADAHGWELSIAESDAGGARFEVRNVTIESDSGSEFEADAHSDADAEPNIDSDTEPDPDTDVDPGFDSNTEPDPDTDVDPGFDSNTESDSDSDTESDSDPHSN